MNSCKIFKSGNSQAVRLPKEYRFDCDEVNINVIGNVVFLIPKNNSWEGFAESLNMFTDDFMENGREQGTFDKRVKL